MKKTLWIVIVVCLFASGCARNYDEKIASLENKTEAIETKLSSLETQISDLAQKQDVSKDYYSKLAEEKTEASAAINVDSLSNEQIQTALKNAGFYSGSIDGQIGPNTEKAIKAFQKENGLKADGIVGAKTKNLLIKHLNKGTD